MSELAAGIRQTLLAAPAIAVGGEAVVAELAAASRRLSLSKGEELIHPGQCVDHLAVIANGAIESSMLAINGDRHITSVLYRGQVIGYIPFFLGTPASFTELAIEPTDVVLIPRDVMLGAMQRCQPLMLGILGELCRRSEHLRQLLADQHLLSPLARVARGLLLLSKWYVPASIHGAASLQVNISQKNLGSVLGLTRQSINMELKHLEAMGLVAVSHSAISIVDRAGLEAVVAAEA